MSKEQEIVLIFSMGYTTLHETCTHIHAYTSFEGVKCWQRSSTCTVLVDEPLGYKKHLTYVILADESAFIPE